jgi:tetratricopeptide (TPR) repeat protein
VQRGIAHYLDFAVHADLAALPERWRLGPRYETATPDRYASRGAALTALVAEVGNLVEATRAAEEFEDWESVAQLCEASWSAQLKAGRHDELVPLLRIAGRVARERLPATRMAGRLHAQLALALVELREFEAAEEALRFAAEADRAAGHLRGRATAVESLGLLRLRQWRWREAHDCFDEAGTLWDLVGPDDDGFADQARARALLHRHRGRALRGLGDIAGSLAQSHTALASFKAIGDEYNAARTLTDLAETHLRSGAPGAALPLIDEALSALESHRADYHVSHLRALRAQCSEGGITEEA